MEIAEYLRFVATKVEEAQGKVDRAEIARLLRCCAETILAKAQEM